MKTDLTLAITHKMAADAAGNEKKALVGHLGTHFDVMNKTFPLDFTELPMAVFDVRGIRGRDVEPADSDCARRQSLPCVKGSFCDRRRWRKQEAEIGAAVSKPRRKINPISLSTASRLPLRG